MSAKAMKMISVAIHSRPLRRISLTPNGGSVGAGGVGGVGGAPRSAGVGISAATVDMSKLEVDESAAAGGAEAQVNHHGGGHRHAQRRKSQHLAESRFAHQLIQPDRGDQ